MISYNFSFFRYFKNYSIGSYLSKNFC